MNTSRRTFLSTAVSVPLTCRVFGERRLLAGPLSSANDKIQQARRVGLSLLSPNDRDMAHGLELHTNSLVFESYGFAPRCAVDGAAIQQAMDANVSDAALADLRLEMMLSRAADDEAERREFVEAFHSAGVTCIFQNAGENMMRVFRANQSISTA